MQPPQYPYEPTPPPQKSNLWRWYRRRHPAIQITLGCVSLIALLFVGLFCSAFIAVLTGHGAQPTPASQSASISTQTSQIQAAQPTHTTQPAATATPTTPNQPTPTSTATPVPVSTATNTPAPKITPTPATIPSASAVLGGMIVAFDNKIGSNNCCQNNGWSDGNTQVDVYGVTDGVNWYQTVGERSTERVSGIFLQLYSSDTWHTLSDAQKAMSPYLPPDAHLIQSLGNGEYEYTSAMLAHTLPASAFVDANNHPETPGLFFAYYHVVGNNPIDYCEMATDRGFQNEVPLPPQ